MVEFYLRKIKDGTIMFENVPPLWKKKVGELIKKEEKSNDEGY